MFEMPTRRQPVAESEAGLEDPREHWARARRPERECDRALTGTSRQWLRRLPPRRRPLRLCQAYPRVANRIAWCWNDHELSRQVLEDLLQDRRGGRRGFAPSIVRELQRLREFNELQRMERHEETLLQVFGRMMGFN